MTLKVITLGQTNMMTYNKQITAKAKNSLWEANFKTTKLSVKLTHLSNDNITSDNIKRPPL